MTRLRWNRKLFAILLIVFSIVALGGSIESQSGPVPFEYVANTVVAASQTGTATILGAASTVSVSSRTISSTNCGTSCGAGNNVSGAPPAVNVDTEYWWSAAVSDSGSLNDIDNVVIYIFKTGATNTNFDQQRAYGFRWVRKSWSGNAGMACSTSTGCWHELTGNNVWTQGSYTYLVTADSAHTTLSGSVTSGIWTFAAKLSKLAQYTSTNMDWNYQVTIQNRALSSGSRTGVLDANLYVSITIPSSVNFGTLSAGLNNQTAASNPYVSTYTGNAILLFQVWGGADPINQYNDTFPLSNIYVGQTGTLSNNDGKKLNYTAQNLYSSLGVAANQNENMYWFVTTPNPFPPGTYTFAYVINIDYQTWAT
jgi:hypothetical protein